MEGGTGPRMILHDTVLVVGFSFVIGALCLLAVYAYATYKDNHKK